MIGLDTLAAIDIGDVFVGVFFLCLCGVGLFLVMLGINYTESKFPAVIPIYNVARVIVVLFSLFLLGAIIFSMAGHPVVRL